MPVSEPTPEPIPAVPLRVRHLGLVPYAPTWQAMRSFTQARTPTTPDELWCCEHPPVYTLGLAANPGHVLNANGIALVQTDRGGEVTYHGPGQAVLYPLLCLQRYGLKVREYVALLEQAVINTLGGLGVAAQRHGGAPGVYVQQPGGLAKIAALGIKLRTGCSYHGLALNVAMDLTPYAGINPCGYTQFSVVDLARLGVKIEACQAHALLVAQLQNQLNTKLQIQPQDPPQAPLA